MVIKEVNEVALIPIVIGVIFLMNSCFQAKPEEELHALMEEAWEYELREDPLKATSEGVHDYNDQLPSVTLDDHRRRNEFRIQLKERLHSINRDDLDRENQINYDIFNRRLTRNILHFEFQSHLIPFTSDSGFHTRIAGLPSIVPLADAQDYENYLARLQQIPRYLQENKDLMREGMQREITMPETVMDGFEENMEPYIVDEPEESIFYEAFMNFPGSIDATRQERFTEEGSSIITEEVIPAFQNLADFIADEYTPASRNTIGASELPGGEAYYEFLVEDFTTLQISPEEVHETGLNEVERIREEMYEVIEATGFEGTFDEFIDYLRTDSQFYAETPEDLLQTAASYAKKIDGRLPELFGTLPRLSYGVEPVPDHLAPYYTGGRYRSGNYEEGRAAYYWVNTYNLESRPLYVLQALTLHEAVPGHHLQFALAQEMENVPEIRRDATITAFSEGWALYAEWLGQEAGFYEDPYHDFGRLTYEMWRACRLVVDTGMHYQGWTEQEAVDYMAEHTALSDHEIGTEIIRYISWPGQALAYKMGELTIRELRENAEQSLGDDFEIRDFHDAVLQNGAIPMKVLEKEIEHYLGEAQ